MRSLVPLLAVFFSPLLSAQDVPPRQGAAADPTARLVRAELLEVSTGDLDAAMAAYRALAADDAAQPETRARALLYLGRCHRKRGELRAAQTVLSDLLRSYPGEKSVGRLARSFLREIRQARAENPDFDWFEEFRQDPAIQARVFELAMGVTGQNTGTEKYQESYSQLLALGSLAVPMLEKLLESSASRSHRHALAGILLQAGRFEALEVLFEDGRAIESTARFHSLVAKVLNLPQDDGRRLLAIVERIPGEKDVGGWLDVLRIAAGERHDLESRLARLETPGGSVFELLLRAIATEPEVARAIVARLGDRGAPVRVRERYFRILNSNHPEALEPANFVPLFLDLEEYGSYWFETVERYQAYAALAALDLPEAFGVALDKYLTKHWNRGNRTFVGVEADWSLVLRANEQYAWLHRLAERNDGAVAVFAEFLTHRSTEAPDYHGYGTRKARWQPSPAYLAAMADVLGVDDSVARAIALEALAHTVSPGNDGVVRIAPEVDAVDPLLETLGTLVLSDPNPFVRAGALRALSNRVLVFPGSQGRVADVLIEGAEKLLALKPEDMNSPLGEPGFKLAAMPSVDLGRQDSGENLLNWALIYIRQEAHDRLAPSVAERTENVVVLTAFLKRGLGRGFLSEIVAQKGTLLAPELRAALLVWKPWKNSGAFAQLAGGKDFLLSVVAESLKKVDVRLRASQIVADAIEAWFDWPKFLASSDPLAAGVLELSSWRRWFPGLPWQRREPLFDAMLESPTEKVAIWTVKHFPRKRPEARAYFEKALTIPHLEAQKLALQVLVKTGDSTIAPLLHDILMEPEKRELREAMSDQIFAFLERLASGDSVVPLRSLLDDPNVDLRARALKSLQTVRENIALRSSERLPPPRPAAPLDGGR